MNPKRVTKIRDDRCENRTKEFRKSERIYFAFGGRNSDVSWIGGRGERRRENFEKRRHSVGRRLFGLFCELKRFVKTHTGGRDTTRRGDWHCRDKRINRTRQRDARRRVFRIIGARTEPIFQIIVRTGTILAANRATFNSVAQPSARHPKTRRRGEYGRTAARGVSPAPVRLKRINPCNPAETGGGFGSMAI